MDYLLLVVRSCWYNPGLNDELCEQVFNILLLSHLKRVHCSIRIGIFFRDFFPVCCFYH